MQDIRMRVMLLVKRHPRNTVKFISLKQETIHTISIPYGLQMQGQGMLHITFNIVMFPFIYTKSHFVISNYFVSVGSVTRPENYTNYNQTYMQAVNNGTNTTTSANPMKLTTKSEEPKSNVDLLSDLDITINHAPLVPEVRPLSVQKKEEVITDNTEDNKSEKSEQNKSCKTEQEITASTENKNDHENLQIVWDTWYNDEEGSSRRTSSITKIH